MLQRTLFFSAVLLLAGCQGTPGTVHVQILPSEYRVGNVRSALATPAVDETVRLKPEKVHVSMCRSTPNAKVIQFDVELRARHESKLTIGLYENCPES